MISSNTRFRHSLEIGRQAQLAQQIARGQTEISTNKRILAPSDAPVDAARVAGIGRQQDTEATWLRNVQTASALASRADTALGGLESLLLRAKELMLTANTDTTSGENREVIAIELRSIAQEIESISSLRDFRGAALFSDGRPLAVPVGANLYVAPVDSMERVFHSVETPQGVTSLKSIILGAADAVTLDDDAARDAAGKLSLEAIDAASTHIAGVRSEQGLRAARLDAIGERLADSGLRLQEERSGLEDTDVAAAIARIQSADISLQAAQSIYAQLNQRTLFDLLR